MEKIDIKKMTKEARRNLLLKGLQYASNDLLWSVRDNSPDIMYRVKQYRNWYRIYRNLRKMLGQEIYNSPRVDMEITFGNWEDY